MNLTQVDDGVQLLWWWNLFIGSEMVPPSVDKLRIWVYLGLQFWCTCSCNWSHVHKDFIFCTCGVLHVSAHVGVTLLFFTCGGQTCAFIYHRYHCCTCAFTRGAVTHVEKHNKTSHVFAHVEYKSVPLSVVDLLFSDRYPLEFLEIFRIAKTSFC